MLATTNPTVTRDEVWTAFRRTHDARLRERYHSILLLMDGRTYPKVAQWLESISIKSLVAMGPNAPGNGAGHSRSPSRERGRPPSTGGSGLSPCDNA